MIFQRLYLQDLKLIDDDQKWNMNGRQFLMEGERVPFAHRKFEIKICYPAEF